MAFILELEQYNQMDYIIGIANVEMVAGYTN